MGKRLQRYPHSQRVLPENSDANIAEDLKTRYIAEGHFIRAFYYFSLVKRFGGVPLIKEVQEYTGKHRRIKGSQKHGGRDLNFIAEECDLAIAGLPESYAATDQFRATKYAAAALKSRAMLYAGSISKYGNLQLNGLVGIPADKANSFFEKSMATSEMIIQSGQFSLYEKMTTKRPITRICSWIRPYTRKRSM